LDYVGFRRNILLWLNVPLLAWHKKMSEQFEIVLCDYKKNEKISLSFFKFMLSMESTYFQKLLNSGMKESAANRIELDLADTNPIFWEILCAPKYDGNRITADNVLGILAESNKYQVTWISKECLRFIERNLHYTQLTDFKQIADETHIPELKTVCDKWLTAQLERVSTKAQQVVLWVEPKEKLRAITEGLNQDNYLTSIDLLFQELCQLPSKSWINLARYYLLQLIEIEIIQQILEDKNQLVYLRIRKSEKTQETAFSKGILASWSGYFKGYFESCGAGANMEKVIEFDCNTFVKDYNFWQVFTNPLSIRGFKKRPMDLIDILTCADKYEVTSMADECKVPRPASMSCRITWRISSGSNCT
jgi:hypothetical protein